MKIIFSFFIVLNLHFGFCCYAQNKNRIDSINHTDKNGLKQGKWIYYESKSKRRIIRTVSPYQSYEYKLYNYIIYPLSPIYKSGDKISEGNYENDKKTGVWKEYYASWFSNNTVAKESEYSNDQKNGTETLYSLRGDLVSKKTFKDGMEEGMKTFYYMNGKVHYEGIWSNGFWKGGVNYHYDSLGIKKEIKYFLDNTDGKAIVGIAGFIYTQIGEHNSISGHKIKKEGGINFNNKIDLLNVFIKIRNSHREIVEKFITDSTGDFSFSLKPNEEYTISFSKEGYITQIYYVSTKSRVGFKQPFYVFTFGLQLREKTENLSGLEILNKPMEKIKYDSLADLFVSDKEYSWQVSKDLTKLNKSTKEILSRYAADNAENEIESLKDESGLKAKELELLKKNKLLKDAELKTKETEILNSKLEADQKQKELELLSKEKELSNALYKQQQTELTKQKAETERNAKELELANQQKVNQELRLGKQQAQLKQQKAETQSKSKELELVNKEKQLQENELKQKSLQRNGFIIGFILVLLLAGFIFNSYRQKQKDNTLLATQKLIIEEKNQDITDSINYAKRIQRSILAPLSDIAVALPNSFILFKPKDIVSGDFYWFELKNDKVFIAAADCTGHGVPGAFMSMLGSDKLNEALIHSDNVSEILSLVNKGVKKALHQSSKEDSTRDGMDIALCSFDANLSTLEFAAANRPLWIIRVGKSELEETKATKCAIGGLTSDEQIFAKHTFSLNKGDTVYVTSDGFADQFSPQDKKLMTKKFKEILTSIQDKSMEEQRAYLDSFIENWKGNMEQTDDILVIGVRTS